VFGCVSYVHIDFDAGSKLDPKSKKCTFIRYGNGEFGYQFPDDENEKSFEAKMSYSMKR
jgi:hypothetical protein